MKKDNIILQAIALTFLNIFAIFYDAEWLQIAVAVDLLSLGVNLKSVYSNKA